jgi:choline-glycine betaine transporter
LLTLGGLRSLQTAAVVVSLPLILIGILMCVSLVKGLRNAEAAALAPSPDGEAR